jgi:hypothetical protein
MFVSLVEERERDEKEKNKQCPPPSLSLQQFYTISSYVPQISVAYA